MFDPRRDRNPADLEYISTHVLVGQSEPLSFYEANFHTGIEDRNARNENAIHPPPAEEEKKEEEIDAKEEKDEKSSNSFCIIS